MEADGDVALSEEERALNLADSQSTIAGVLFDMHSYVENVSCPCG